MPDYLGDVMKMGKGNKALKKATNAYALDLINRGTPDFAKTWNTGAAGKWGAGVPTGSANLGYLTQGGNLASLQHANDLMAKLQNRQAGIQNLTTGIGLKQQGWANNDILKQAAQNIQNIKAGYAAQQAADKAAMWQNLINSGFAIAGNFAGGAGASNAEGSTTNPWGPADQGFGNYDFNSPYLNSQPNQLIPSGNDLQMNFRW